MARGILGRVVADLTALRPVTDRAVDSLLDQALQLLAHVAPRPAPPHGPSSAGTDGDAAPAERRPRDAAATTARLSPDSRAAAVLHAADVDLRQAWTLLLADGDHAVHDVAAAAGVVHNAWLSVDPHTIR
ncbi:MAG: hypothetical protein R2726_03740 [Acidimicrobiales bacterium]